MLKVIPDSEYRYENKNDLNEKGKEVINISEKNIISILNEYMDGKLKTKFGEQDVSYEWIENDKNIEWLNTSIKSDLNNIRDVTEKRDKCCELKVY
jgi:hypothetical protein